MNPNAATADAAVLVVAIVTLLAIAGKLIVANLIQRSKKSFAVQEVRRTGFTDALGRRLDDGAHVGVGHRRRRYEERHAIDIRRPTGDLPPWNVPNWSVVVNRISICSDYRDW